MSGRRLAGRRLVAIDGTGGSGKSTVAGIVSHALDLPHIDTGATYRLVASEALSRDIPLDRPEDVAAVAEDVARRTSFDGRLRFDGRAVGPEIRTPEITKAASVVAAHPEVRRVLVGMQRALVPPQGAVVEGRDIGTVVWPGADVKVFLDAREEVRAARRADEASDGAHAPEALRERDERDASRPVGAMRPAPDAIVIDTSDRSPDAVAQVVLDQLGHPAPSAPLLYRGIRTVTTALLHTLFRLEVRGAEHVPTRGAGILAPNHRSLLDIPVAATTTPRQIHFMAKEELFSNRYAAAFFTRVGSYPVRRGRPDRSALLRSLELLGAGQLIGLFPEGTRRPGARFEALEEGLAYVALKSGAPVVPIAISGTESVFPPGRRLPRPVKVRVRVGPPFTLGGPVIGVLRRSRIRDATQLAGQRMRSVMTELEP